MHEPQFIEPVDNTPTSRIDKSKITRLLIQSDSSLGDYLLIGRYRSYEEIRKLASTKTALEFLDGIPNTQVKNIRTCNTPKALGTNFQYDIPFDGSTELMDEYSYWIAAFNKNSDRKNQCTIKDLHVDAAGQVLVQTPERLTSLRFINITTFRRRPGSSHIIECSGTSSAAVISMVLSEVIDGLPVTYAPYGDVTGPTNWSCYFIVGSDGVGARVFTFHGVNQNFESVQITDTL